jgi:hypothetical protein
VVTPQGIVAQAGQATGLRKGQDFVRIAFAAVFAQYDGRSKKWLAVDPPPAIATQVLEKGRWQFPKVAGVITAPTLRPDGMILDVRPERHQPSPGRPPGAHPNPPALSVFDVPAA